MKFCFWGSIAKGFEGKPIGGGEHQLFLISKYVNKLGHKVIIIDFEIGSDKKVGDIEIISLSKRSKNRIIKYISFYRLLKNINSDIYYSRIRSSIHLLGMLAAKRNSSLFVYHIASDLDVMNFKARWEGYYSKLTSFLRFVLHFTHSELLFPIILKNADLIIAQNDEQYQYLLRFRKKRISIIYNLFEFSKKETIQVPNQENNYYTFVGSLDLRKGIKELLYVISENKNANFIIIGNPRDKAGRDFIQNIEKHKNVRYLKQLPHYEVIKYLRGSNGLISTSRYEGFSNVFIEAWSLGIPVFSLFVNPSKVITKFNLGKFYNGKIETMKRDLVSNNIIISKKDIINYVKEYHNPQKNVQLIIKECKKYV